jgi:hypothetical protein
VIINTEEKIALVMMSLDTSEVVEVDAKAATVARRWPTTP